MSRFKDYATSTAFSISLSRAMCEAMEYVALREMQEGSEGFQIFSGFPLMTSLQSLERRGLVENVERTWRMTEAGKALYPLLMLAGLARGRRELSALIERSAA